MNTTPDWSIVSTMKKLTSTSYVLLGQLAAQSWSAYDLTKHLKRSNLRDFWPRAESHIYDEIKNLVAHDFSTVEDKAIGKRQRSVYSITRKGRSALKKWVAEPARGRIVEWEQLIKISYADYGSKDDLLQQISDIRKDIISRVQGDVDLLDATPALGKTFPHRLHIGTLNSALIIPQLEAILDWTDWVEAEIASWPNTRQSVESDETISNHLPTTIASMKKIISRYD
ncbi:MAG: PadR family transcriptional regulator [Gammaproteobacteria bacterium]|nr:PadR family transcriptional regulator [Gammaproteobacteria bacterium]MBQ0839348.1 PadR family transcriptional regulator [Gammaproteobacteria bacterium]